MNVSLGSALLCACLALGCGDGSHEGSHAEDAGAHQHESDASVRCGADVPPFAIDMTAMGEQARVRAVLRAAVPAPPEKYRNDWLVELQDGTGAPLTDATLSARPFMPAHGHDGTFPPVITDKGQGRFQVDDLNLWMRGPWEVQLTVSSQSAGDDYIVFRVCIEE